jgi:hypothetical protein
MSGQSGPVDIRRAHRIINRLTVEWFDRILKGKGRAVEQLQGEFPELRVVSGADRTKG